MKIEITGRNCEVSDHLKKVAENKIGKLDKYFLGKDAEAKVCFKKEGSSFTAEIMLDYFGKFVRAAAAGDNFYDDLDVVLPRIEGQIRKHRTRFDKEKKNTAFAGDAFYAGAEKEFSDKVVKEKKFTLKSMTVDEAIEEMELLGHSFYVFLEVKTNTIQVLYRRNDGDLGLIEPQI